MGPRPGVHVRVVYKMSCLPPKGHLQKLSRRQNKTQHITKTMSHKISRVVATLLRATCLSALSSSSNFYLLRQLSSCQSRNVSRWLQFLFLHLTLWAAKVNKLPFQQFALSAFSMNAVSTILADIQRVLGLFFPITSTISFFFASRLVVPQLERCSIYNRHLISLTSSYFIEV